MDIVNFNKNVKALKAIVTKILFATVTLLFLSCFFFDTKTSLTIQNEMLQQAQDAEVKGNYIQALNRYNLLLALDKTSKVALRSLSHLYIYFSENNRAIELIENYKKCVPGDNEFDSVLGELYYRTQDYQKALGYLSDGKISMLKKAICYEKTGNLFKAESTYNAITPFFYTVSDFLTTRIAYCEVIKGVPESSVDLFDKLKLKIKRRNELYIVEKDLLNYFTNNKNYTEGLRFVKVMQEDFPERINISNLRRANILLAMGDKKNSVNLYHSVLKNGGEGAYSAGIQLLNMGELLPNEYQRLAYLCFSRGNYKTAIYLLKKIMLQTHNRYQNYLLGMSYYRMGEYKKAHEIFLPLVNEYPEKRQQILYYIGKTEEKIGDYESALKNYTTAGREKKSKYADNAIYLSGLLKEDKGNFAGAIRSYKRLKNEFAKGDCLYRAMLRGGILSYKMNNLPLAESFFYRALKLSKKNSSDYVAVIFWLSRLADRMGNERKGDSLRNIIQKETPLSYYSFYLGGKDIITKQELKKWFNTWCDTVVTLSDEEKVYFERGKIFLEIGMPKKAMESFANIKKTPYFNFVLAKLFKEKGFNYESILYSLKVKASSSGGYLSKAPVELLRLEYPLLYLPTVIEESKKYNVSPELILALIHQESAFRKDAVSVANAVGLSQLLPSVAREVADENMIDYDGPEDLKKKPKLSIKLGTAHLSKLQKKFRNYLYSLAGYNAGMEKAEEWKNKWGGETPTYLDMISYSETRYYVKRVLAKAEIYKLLWNLSPEEIKKTTQDYSKK
ncbi:MAG: hypothetical protein B5M53_01515 [Candidatus Cloacimonas sp. 4484_209]|nr:MAG: hypothetical protein B5M53_01515 [Candidatus Cloacimonas sp. 4484_209]